MMKRHYVVVAIGLLLVLGLGQTVRAQHQISVKRPTKVGQLHVPGEVIVKFKRGMSERSISDAISRHGAATFLSSRFAGFKRVRVRPGATVADMVARFSEDPNVEYAEPNYIAYAHMVPNDEYYQYQWNFDAIHMEDAWDVETGNSGVIVAIVDTGIAYENRTEGFWWRRNYYYQAPDLAQTNFVSGYDFVNNDNHPNDDEGHGTHVAGTVAQSTNNGIGTAGIAFNVSIMPVKVLDRNGSGSYADVSDGIRFAADNGAKVINLSLGGPSPSATLKQALAYAYDKGVTIVCSAGNDGSADTLGYPAAYDEYCIAVGATRYDKTVSYYSNRGPSLDIVAPGGDLNVDQNGDGYGDGVLQQTFGNNTNDWSYWFYQGTSMAAPHVSGVAALLIAHGVGTTPDEVKQVLQSTAHDLGSAGFDWDTGHGLLDARAALQGSAGVVDQSPTVGITSPADGATVSGAVQIQAAASDDDGVDQVAFYVDGSLIGTDTSNPYGVSWNSAAVSDDLHVIEAIALDTIAQASTDSIVVTVNNVSDAPVADAGSSQTVSDSDGSGVESVTLDGSGSYDPDGAIASYEWMEGGILLGTASVVSYDFSVGTHTVTLTVTDNDAMPATDTVFVDVLANEAPVASAGPDRSVSIGASVVFDGSGSDDSDGSIVSYAWDFGDGGSGSGLNANYSYSSPGDYTVTLTVADEGGLSDTDTASIAVTEASGPLEVFSDSFEVSAWNGLWTEDSQNDWFRSSQRVLDGTRSAEVDGRAYDATLTSIPIDLQGRSAATITFSWFIERGVDRGEYLAFDVSTNGGASWVENARLRGNVDPEHRWHNVSVGLTGLSNLRIRFRARMSSFSEDAFVDIVRVVAQ